MYDISKLGDYHIAGNPATMKPDYLKPGEFKDIPV
jgi:hypothetical protein